MCVLQFLILRVSDLTTKSIFVVNESIKGKFLDLKEGAFVVSLRPFSQPKSSITSRNVSRLYCLRKLELNATYRLTTLVEFSKLAKGHSIRIAFPGRQVRTTTTSIESIVAHMPVIELSITVLDHLRFGVHVQEDSLLNLSSFVSLSLLALLIAS